MQMASSTVFSVRGFASAKDCKTLVILADKKLRPSAAYSAGAGRTSSSAWLDSSEHPVVESLRRAVAEQLGVSEERIERLQVVRYRPGEFFGLHHDCFGFGKYGPSDAERLQLEVAGQRTHTALLYLNTVKDGGKTSFPRLNYQSSAEQGKCLFWRNTTDVGEPNELMVHSGETPRSGPKYAVNFFVREHPYRTPLRSREALREPSTEQSPDLARSDGSST
eukprot:gnl/Hemi2/1875_TR669_c0_g1_i1.p2 gnl/Hemi2/1875_TR669_c0_g1~~gnl/Hemi2/1875_TR669_c0_g1_i1.p2  ORF type:complete len:231 (-),score=17.08 gnl/Hemi2/1875_TR669_c0_g1_i1:692-1354(-)